MTNDEFERQIARARPDCSPDIRFAIVKPHLEEGRTTEQDRRICLAQIDGVAGEMSPDSGRGNQSEELIRRGPANTPRSRVARHQRLEAIEPVIRLLRRALFGEPSPPFTKAAEAAAWIEDQHATESSNSLDRFGRPCPRVHYLDQFGRPWPRLNYLNGNRRVASLTVRRDGALGAIAYVARTLAPGTGFPETEIVRYVFTGSKPRLTRYRAKERKVWCNVSWVLMNRCLGGRLPGFRDAISAELGQKDQGHLELHTIILELDAPDLTLEELNEVYHRIRKRWPRNSRHRITEDDEQLIELMRQKGLANQKHHSQTTWDQLAKKYGGNVNPDALRKRWARLWKDDKRVLWE